MIGIPPLTFFGHPLDANQYYAFAVVVGFAWFAVFRNLVISRHGPALLVLRQSPVLASSLGIPVRQLKLKAYALGAVPCGIAGVLFANLNHFISPSNPGPVHHHHHLRRAGRFCAGRLDQRLRRRWWVRRSSSWARCA